MITRPTKPGDYADRDLDCQLALEDEFQRLVSASQNAGWERIETLKALVQLAIAHVHADTENGKTEAQIALANRQLH